MVNLLGLAMKLTGLNPMDSVSQVANVHVYGFAVFVKNPSV